MARSIDRASLLSHFRNLSLVGLSLVLLPISLSLALSSTLLRLLGLVKTPEPRPSLRNGRQIRVLVTGVGMAKGLFLCRSFYLGGCRVIATDLQQHLDFPCGRFSKAVSRYYAAPNPAGSVEKYISSVIGIVKQERIDLCVTCSGVATAVEDGLMAVRIERETSCKVFQFNDGAIRALDDKLRFMKQTDDIGMPNPRWHALTSSDDLSGVLSQLENEAANNPEIRYILKNSGMDDASRGAIPLLKPSHRDETRAILNSLELGKAQRWVLQEYFPGTEEYCTHGVIVNGHVRAFVACPSASILMHYRALRTNTSTYRELLSFTEHYAAALSTESEPFTGHLSFDFRVRHPPEGVDEARLVPIECNPRCHTATVLFRGREREVTEAYLSCLPGRSPPSATVEPARNTYPCYWIGHDIVAFLLQPALRMCLLFDGETLLDGSLREFITHLVSWKDPTFEWWDPVPWLTLYHVYWPLTLLRASMNGQRWSQLNVSTTKMFRC